MSASDPLSQLATVLAGSPAMYLGDSGIASYPGAPAVKQALGTLVADHRRIADRVTEILEEREVTPPRSGYPMAFTAWHDLDLGYIVPRVVEQLRAQVRACDAIAAGGGDAAAVELAREAAAVSGRHADALGELTVRLRAGLAPAAG